MSVMQPWPSPRSTFLAVAVALVGISGAVVSCGPTEPIRCSADTCAGCCTGDDKCIALVDQAFNVCGANGKICASCLPGQLCAPNGACANDPDAGQVGLCDPSTCSGCCAGEVCVDTASQNAQECGQGGQQCAPCLSGSSCQSGSCVQAMDAGVCGKKGAACCAMGGCFLGLSCQKGVCDTATTTDGGTTTMDGGTAADGGTTGTQPVGGPCLGNAQCQSGLCKVLGFPNGYCTQSCASVADCPLGSTCGTDPTDSSGTTKICMATCPVAGAGGGCRTGYVCEKRGSTTGAAMCQPGCVSATTCGTAGTCDSRGFCCGSSGYACCEGTTCDNGLLCASNGYCAAPPPDAGPGPGGIGDPCSVPQSCASNVCVQEEAGGNAGCSIGPCWPGGYCIDDCTNSACPSGSSCSPATWLASNAICVENCATAGGQSTCRSGYVCDKGWALPSTQPVCVDACNGKADCNSATLDCFQGFCCGKVSYRCCSASSCPYSGTCGADGYCQ